MGKEITVHSSQQLPGLPASCPKLAPRVAAAIQTRTNWRFTPEDEHGNPTRYGGALPEIIGWDIPTTITQSLIDAAQEHLHAWREFMRPCDKSIVAEWLAHLGVMCGGPKMSVDEAKEKIAVYAMGLAFPAFCFSQKNLYAAAEKFKWFPTFSEVTDWLHSKSSAAETTLSRLEMLAAASPTKPKEPDIVRRVEDATPEQREAHMKAMRELKTRLIAQGVGSEPEADRARRLIDKRIAQQRALMAPMIEAARAKFMEENRDEPGAE